MTEKQLPSDQRGYEYYDGTGDDDGDFLLIRKEDLENLNVKGVSGNTNFDDIDELDEGARFVSELPPIPKGKYYVVRIIETQEY